MDRVAEQASANETEAQRLRVEAASLQAAKDAAVAAAQLRDRPVVLLSNNDGCAVARSNEVKALGVPMGAPWFR